MSAERERKEAGERDREDHIMEKRSRNFVVVTLRDTHARTHARTRWSGSRTNPIVLWGDKGGSSARNREREGRPKAGKCNQGAYIPSSSYFQSVLCMSQSLSLSSSSSSLSLSVVPSEIMQPIKGGEERGRRRPVSRPGMRRKKRTFFIFPPYVCTPLKTSLSLLSTYTGVRTHVWLWWVYIGLGHNYLYKRALKGRGSGRRLCQIWWEGRSFFSRGEIMGAYRSRQERRFVPDVHFNKSATSSSKLKWYCVILYQIT